MPDHSFIRSSSPATIFQAVKQYAGEIVAKNDLLVQKVPHFRQQSLFSSGSGAPPFLLYLDKIMPGLSCSPICFIYTLVFIDRLQKNKIILLTTTTAHKTFLACSVIAAKYLDDKFFYNTFYASVGMVTLEEFNLMELQMLANLRFHLYIRNSFIEEYFRRILARSQHVPRRTSSAVDVVKETSPEDNNSNNLHHSPPEKTPSSISGQLQRKSSGKRVYGQPQLETLVVASPEKGSPATPQTSLEHPKPSRSYEPARIEVVNPDHPVTYVQMTPNPPKASTQPPSVSVNIPLSIPFQSNSTTPSHLPELIIPDIIHSQSLTVREHQTKGATVENSASSEPQEVILFSISPTVANPRTSRGIFATSSPDTLPRGHRRMLSRSSIDSAMSSFSTFSYDRQLPIAPHILPLAQDPSQTPFSLNPSVVTNFFSTASPFTQTGSNGSPRSVVSSTDSINRPTSAQSLPIVYPDRSESFDFTDLGCKTPSSVSISEETHSTVEYNKLSFSLRRGNLLSGDARDTVEKVKLQG
ncbi:hypothetical protein BLNAU_315 [Blattamonas nauphoetae]|uniref:Cyclin n=1 Tax=Blattamonas nauphoetae TaxID=2049346 RepID=A0ABQ9YLG7_9EUKA|nr:hypothetical protein BLNAU_315 [Blattamonas nauphoetae]